ncbi:MAG: glycosyltransferase [Ruminococcaceae bacterium]|nr:glycosyltransferase [Oscillospiraceae bacterium]
MKVLILSVTAGQGHNSTAKAISDYLTGYGADVRVLDTMRYINRLLGKTVDLGYLFVSSRAKLAYKGAYRLAEMRKKTTMDTSPGALTIKFIASKLQKYISAYNPDVIICTHVFAGMFINVLKESEKLKAKTIGILTDFAFHPYWEEGDNLDYIVVPSENLYFKACQKGFDKSQILPFGIPINPKFEYSMPKDAAKRHFGLDSDKKTLLLMGGSMGYGNIAKTLKKLDDIEGDFQIINICGNNKRSKKTIDEMIFKKKVLNFGFVDYVDELMDAADVIVTKPGGLTSSEAMAKGLPMVIVNPIPGQEDRNTEFLLNNGCAMAVSPTYELEEIIYTLMNNEKRLEIMRESIADIARPDSTKRLCNFVMGIEKKKSLVN